MGDDRDVRIFDCAEDAVGDLLARLLLAVVDAGDDPVGLGQHVVGQVHAAFFQDVALDAFEDVKPLGARSSGRSPSTARAARSGSRPLAMLTRCEWSVMAMYFRPRSWAAATISSMRRAAVAGGGVHVQVAANVVQLDQLGQLAGGGPVELAAAFADFRRKDGQVQRGVDFFLGAAGDRAFPSSSFDAKHAVFVDLQAVVLGHAAQDDVVVLRAGEVLQGRAERFWPARRAGRFASPWPCGSTFSCRRGR